MPEIKVTLNHVEDLELKAKIVEEKDKGEVVDRKVITKVSFDYEGTPMMLNQVLLALANGHQVSVVFQSPQSVMSVDIVEPVAVASK